MPASKFEFWSIRIIGLFGVLIALEILLSPFKSFPKFDELVLIKGNLIEVGECSKGKRPKFTISIQNSSDKEQIYAYCTLRDFLVNQVGNHIVVGTHFDNEGLLSFLFGGDKEIWHIELEGNVIYDYEARLEREGSGLFSLIFLVFLIFAGYLGWNHRHRLRK